MSMQRSRSCGRVACGRAECSSAIHANEFLTFGRGHLDADGFWEIPCRACAEASDKQQAHGEEQARQALIRFGAPEREIEQFMRDAKWLRNPAWPFAEGSELPTWSNGEEALEYAMVG